MRKAQSSWRHTGRNMRECLAMASRTQAATNGTRPRARWDGSPWPEDSVSGPLAEQGLSARYLLVQVKADWGELSSTLGFPTWSSYHSPCFMCACNKASMFTFTDIGL
eukprot:5925929-Pyramimonas_sp.AAC.1